MKSKILTLIAVSAVVTLSFTFGSPSKSETKVTASKPKEAPIGGFAIEDSERN